MNNLDHALDISASPDSTPEGGVHLDAIDSHHEGKDGASDLLKLVLDAHGGNGRWKRFAKVSSQVVSGGFLWAMKGIPLDKTPRRMTSEFRHQCSRTEPFGDPGWHMTYTPDRVAIETRSGEIVAEQSDPRNTFVGHVWDTPWTPLQLGYFNGCHVDLLQSAFSFGSTGLRPDGDPTHNPRRAAAYRNESSVPPKRPHALHRAKSLL